MNVKIMKINEDIIEKDFPFYIKEKGYNCIRICYKNLMEIRIISKLNLELEAGMPDFFIYNEKEFYYCEFKSKTDSISIPQIKWFSRHINYPRAIAIVDLKEEMSLIEDYKYILSLDYFTRLQFQYQEEKINLKNDFWKVIKDIKKYYEGKFEFLREIMNKVLEENALLKEKLNSNKEVETWQKK